MTHIERGLGDYYILIGSHGILKIGNHAQVSMVRWIDRYKHRLIRRLTDRQTDDRNRHSRNTKE